MDFCASLESNKCKANRALHRLFVFRHVVQRSQCKSLGQDFNMNGKALAQGMYMWYSPTWNSSKVIAKIKVFRHVHIQFQASIYTISMCHGHSWRVRLDKQESLTPPGHLVSPLVCWDPWMSTVVLYSWCHSDSASVLLYFTFFVTLVPFAVWSW